MQKTLTFTITLDEIEAGKAAEVLAGAGLTPEGVIRQLLERTAREGVVPLRKGRARPKRTDGGDAGAHFVQGDLFARPDPAEPFYSFNPPAAKPETLLPSLVTLRALQDAQAKLRWRERERESADGSSFSKPSSSGSTNPSSWATRGVPPSSPPLRRSSPSSRTGAYPRGCDPSETATASMRSST